MTTTMMATRRRTTQKASKRRSITRFDHQADYAADDGAESDYADTHFGWRSKARRSKRGRLWVPPDIRAF